MVLKLQQNDGVRRGHKKFYVKDENKIKRYKKLNLALIKKEFENGKK